VTGTSRLKASHPATASVTIANATNFRMKTSLEEGRVAADLPKD